MEEHEITMSLPPVLRREIILQHPEVTSFGELLAVIRRHAKEGGRVFMEVDLKPEFPDTPGTGSPRSTRPLSGGSDD